MTDFRWQDTFHPLLNTLRAEGLEAWAGQLEQQLVSRFETRPHGDVGRWQAALMQLPPMAGATLKTDTPTVTVASPEPLGEPDESALEAGLRGLMPWRKGPFRFFGQFVDTEWRSDWKWARVAPWLSDLHGRRVLDVGCGSGYHLWRMAGAGARQVIGIDPGLLFLFQFLAVKRYAPESPVDLLPIRMEDMPAGLGCFDTTFSMGVLYHRRSPIDHLLELKDTLRPGGELVLETLVVEGPQGNTLMPEDSYAQMRNVWFLPSCDTLVRWLERSGYDRIRVVDVTATTTQEQRATDWMRFQSLADFLDPEDPTRTLEGYPAPIRATVIARRKPAA